MRRRRFVRGEACCRVARKDFSDFSLVCGHPTLSGKCGATKKETVGEQTQKTGAVCGATRRNVASRFDCRGPRKNGWLAASGRGECPVNVPCITGTCTTELGNPKHNSISQEKTRFDGIIR